MQPEALGEDKTVTVPAVELAMDSTTIVVEVVAAYGQRLMSHAGDISGF